MTFNDTILNALNDIASKGKFKVIREFTNYIEVSLNDIIFAFNYDVVEKTNSFFVGIDGLSLFHIDNGILKAIFNSSINIEVLEKQIFINNLIVFLTNEGKPLVEGDKNVIDLIGKYVYRISRDYTNVILHQQQMDILDNAWLQGNFQEFIECMDKLDKENIPQSYSLKYKIALRKIQKN